LPSKHVGTVKGGNPPHRLLLLVAHLLNNATKLRPEPHKAGPELGQ
jgi:hypothetical protein